MLKVLRQSSRWTLLFFLFPSLSTCFVAAQVTATQRQLDRVDLSVNAIGQFTKGVSGTNYQGVSLSEDATNTVGALVTLRYTKSPLVGFEGNVTYARYTENFSSYIVGGVQARVSEYTLGYVAHGPRVLGLRSFGAGGVGSTSFSPTVGGGQSLPERARLTFYYAAGVEAPLLSEHFGVRAQFRQTFFKAPDFDQNYLAINRRTFTTEPGIGFYLRF